MWYSVALFFCVLAISSSIYLIFSEIPIPQPIQYLIFIIHIFLAQKIRNISASFLHSMGDDVYSYTQLAMKLTYPFTQLAMTLFIRGYIEAHRTRIEMPRMYLTDLYFDFRFFCFMKKMFCTKKSKIARKKLVILLAIHLNPLIMLFSILPTRS